MPEMNGLKDELILFLRLLVRDRRTEQSSATKIQKHTLGELHDLLSTFQQYLQLELQVGT